MSKKISAKEFLNRARDVPVFDVRSPGEFKHGHIPGAINLPLFENQEREIVGILYKNKGRQEAIRKGLEIVGPKMTSLIDKAIKHAHSGEILIHCWRGGMRSSSVAWLFEAAGLTVYLLEGGYKHYRNFIRGNMLNNRLPLVLGGLTGSGKTILIKALFKAGEPVIDLEGLANHRGSAFGGVGLADQPSTEYFENLLYEKMSKISGTGYVWVEDESRRIGQLFIPDNYHNAMRESPVVLVKVSDIERRNVLINEYGNQPNDELLASIKILTKRLGGLITKQAMQAVDNQDYGEVVDLLLPYYDKLYSYGLNKRNVSNIHPVDLSQLSDLERTKTLSEIRVQLEERKL